MKIGILGPEFCTSNQVTPSLALLPLVGTAVQNISCTTQWVNQSTSRKRAD